MTVQTVKLKKRLKTTTTGPVKTIRVDPAFLCECGCGGRVKSNTRFYSRECRRKKAKTPAKIIYKCRWCGGTVQLDEKYCSAKCEQFDALRKKNKKFKRN